MEDLRKDMTMGAAPGTDPKDNTTQDLPRCPVCGEPTEEYFSKQMAQYFPEYKGKTYHRQCACERAAEEAEQEFRTRQEHENTVQRLSSRCFSGNNAMRQMTFASSTSDHPSVITCRKYVEKWEEAKANNLGLLLWGDVGTGKSYMAASIANALLEQEISVRMLNSAM